MAVRDFDETQLATDFAAILSQAGITFSYYGTTVTGVWAASRNIFEDFEDQRRNDEKFTVFLTTSQLSRTLAVAQTLVRGTSNYFIERISLDAEGTGVEIDVCKVI